MQKSLNGCAVGLRRWILRPLSQPALPLLLLGQLEVGVGQDPRQRAEDPQRLTQRRQAEETEDKNGADPGGEAHLVEGQRVVEEQVSSNQSDAELEMAKHVVAERRRS